MLQDILTCHRRRGAVRDLFDRALAARDPLAHPALRAMSAVELADIPFPRPPRDSSEPRPRS